MITDMIDWLRAVNEANIYTLMHENSIAALALVVLYVLATVAVIMLTLWSLGKLYDAFLGFCQLATLWWQGYKLNRKLKKAVDIAVDSKLQTFANAAAGVGDASPPKGGYTDEARPITDKVQLTVGNPNPKSLLPDEVGYPPYVGWWLTRYIDSQTSFWRWWDGKVWSRGIPDWANEVIAGEAAKVVDSYRAEIRWTWAWPFNTPRPREGFDGSPQTRVLHMRLATVGFQIRELQGALKVLEQLDAYTSAHSILFDNVTKARNSLLSIRLYLLDKQRRTRVGLMAEEVTNLQSKTGQYTKPDPSLSKGTD